MLLYAIKGGGRCWLYVCVCVCVCVYLAQMVRGDSQDPVPIMRLNSSDPDGGEPGHGGPLDLWPLLWQAR